MTGVPYADGKPLRCRACGSLPAIKLTDRAPGPWCARHLPWRPTVPAWHVARCRKCSSKGSRVVDNLGRRHGPFCREHLPTGWAFDSPTSNALLSDIVSEQLAWQSRGSS